MTMTSFLRQLWNSLFNTFNSASSIGACSPETPMYCPGRELGRLFEKPSLPIAKIINSGRRSIDVNALTVNNDVYWKGFYASDSPIPAWIFQSGFTKRFWLENELVVGVTSTFDDNVKAKNI